MLSRIFLFMLFCAGWCHAGNLRVDVVHQFDEQPLQLGSLKYQGEEKFSVTRLSYLLSEFAVQTRSGNWIEISDQYAYVDVAKRRTRFFLTKVPEGDYKAVRFSLGVPKKQNHADPALLAADSPLNPNLNQLHWDWTGGYIFLALEGRYYAADNSLKGYVYHLANDNNYSRVQLPVSFRVKENTGIVLGFDVKKLLSQPQQLSFVKSGDSTHSHPGDPIASALVANFQSALSVLNVSYPEGEQPQKFVKPLYLPEKYTPYRFKMSRRFPRPALPRDNPLTKERVELGRKLFHDTRLSRDHTISCASCHHQDKAFTDGVPLSAGVENRKGKRNSMPLFNLAWKSSFFWDGRAGSLREQALMPIQDHLEMDESLESVVKKLKGDPQMVVGFSKAFTGEITEEKLGLALEAFMLTLTSHNSKFDRAMAGKEKLTVQEQHGMQLFFTENEPRSGRRGADCFHCHGGANFSDHQFHNNGLAPLEIADLGLFEVSKKLADKFKFSTPSLRNLTKTAPYMHDGRFETLEEVIEHYSGPMHQSETLDPNLAKHPKAGLQLTAEEKADLLTFLKTLSES